ncbi:unnamed protein product [Dibothriocephalus latus]|uniref:Pentatricopeptide repeat-containing protein n=1 Tax=Dibothriocephalus latus TaxID=60516 RepID=A0A3P7RQ87_DIBLA|nr:unnamed protein product [Dibothriocephalus latus]
MIAKTSRPKGHGGKEGAEQPTRNLVGFKTNYIVMLGVCAQNKLDDALGLFKAMREDAMKM